MHTSIHTFNQLHFTPRRCSRRAAAPSPAAARALAASARRSLASRLSGRIHPALPHLFTAHRSGDAATTATPSPLHPPQPLFRSSQFPLPQSSGSVAQTLTRFPFGIHLAAAGLSRRGFSSLPPYRVADAGAVLTEAAAAPVAPANFPSEVAWVAGDSSLSVEAVQNLIGAVHSFTGLNWWLSIAVSTVLLRSVLFTLMLTFRKQILVAREELSAITKLTKSAKDEKSEQEAEERMLSFCKSFGPLAFIAMLTPYTFMSLYFAISNMVQKLPSLKEGGAFWFTDLTTPDTLFIFPAMASLSMLLRFEFLLHCSKTKKSRRKTDFVRILLVLTFPFIATFPEAICCYLVTWSLTSLAQSIVIHQPAVKKLLFNKANSPTGPSSQAPTGPTAEDSPCPVDENEQTLHPERREASDSSIDQDRDQSDTKPEKDK